MHMSKLQARTQLNIPINNVVEYSPNTVSNTVVNKELAQLEMNHVVKKQKMIKSIL